MKELLQLIADYKVWHLILACLLYIIINSEFKITITYNPQPRSDDKKLS